MTNEEYLLDCQELQRLLEFTNRPNVQELLRKNISETEAMLSSNPTSKDDDKPKPASLSLPVSKIRTYGWDQSEKFVKLYITLKGVQTLPAENIKVEYTPVSFKLFVKNLNNKNMELIINNLAAKIDVEKTSHKVKTDEVVLLLRKAETGTWSVLTQKEIKAKEKDAPKLDKEEDPSAGIMSMMRNMYEEGDDDMKRTIAKAWTENRDKSGAGGMGF